MQTWQAEILLKSENILGEGAIWHKEWQKFIYVDIEGRKIGRIDPQLIAAEELTLAEMPGTVVPHQNGKLIVASEKSILELDFETGETKEVIKVESEKPGNRLNDGKCDALGRLWFGTMNK